MSNILRSFLLTITFLVSFSQLQAQIGIVISASQNYPVNWISEFYEPNWGFKAYITPNALSDGLRWNIGFGWTKFQPKAELFYAETRNGVYGDVAYSSYNSVPIFAEMEFKIIERPFKLFGGVNAGINAIRYEVYSRDPLGERTEPFNGANMFFAPRLGVYLVDNDRMAISLDTQYYATLNYKAAWLEDYLGFNLSFMIKTNSYFPF